MKRGYKRESKGMAFVRFVMGILLILIVLVAGYLLLNDDYTGRIVKKDSPSAAATTVAQTQNAATPAPTASATAKANVSTVASNGNAATPAPVIATPTPAPTPVPTPTPAPTPVPTQIPTKLLAKRVLRQQSDIPDPVVGTEAKITKAYVSSADDYGIMEVCGYAYIDSTDFKTDGLEAYLVISQQSTGSLSAYQATIQEGVSGEEHMTTFPNPGKTDFQVFFSVDDYPDGVYSLGIVIGYKEGNGRAYSYAPMDHITFTVVNKQVLTVLGNEGNTVG